MCNSCPICLDTLNQEKGNYLRLKCKHEFHFNCIFQLIASNQKYNNNCPMCREKIVDEEKDVQIHIIPQQIVNMRNMIDNLVTSHNVMFRNLRNTEYINSWLLACLFMFIFYFVSTFFIFNVHIMVAQTIIIPVYHLIVYIFNWWLAHQYIIMAVTTCGIMFASLIASSGILATEYHRYQRYREFRRRFIPEDEIVTSI